MKDAPMTSWRTRVIDVYEKYMKLASSSKAFMLPVFPPLEFL